MPSRIDICLCVSELQRSLSLGSYRCELGTGLASHACDQVGMRARSRSCSKAARQQGSFDMDAAVVSRLRAFEGGEGVMPCRVDGEQRSAEGQVAAMCARRRTGEAAQIAIGCWLEGFPCPVLRGAFLAGDPSG